MSEVGAFPVHSSADKMLRHRNRGWPGPSAVPSGCSPWVLPPSPPLTGSHLHPNPLKQKPLTPGLLPTPTPVGSVTSPPPRTFRSSRAHSTVRHLESWRGRSWAETSKVPTPHWLPGVPAGRSSVVLRSILMWLVMFSQKLQEVHSFCIHSHPGGPGTLKGHTQQPHKTRSNGSRDLPRAEGWSHSQGLLQTTALCSPLTSVYKPVMTKQRLLSHQCFSVPLFRPERLEELKQKPDQETLLREKLTFTCVYFAS